jgi:hypothetical protein
VACRSIDYDVKWQIRVKIIYLDVPHNSGNGFFIYPTGSEGLKEHYELHAETRDAEGLLPIDDGWLKDG